MFKRLTSYFDKRRNRWAERTLEKIKADVSEGNHDPTALENASNGVITIHGNHFEIRGSKEATITKWENIDVIHAYKADLWSYDLICIAFGKANDDTMIEVSEEMEGFVALRNKLNELLPSFDDAYSKWLLSSAPFDAALVEIWKKNITPSP